MSGRDPHDIRHEPHLRDEATPPARGDSIHDEPARAPQAGGTPAVCRTCGHPRRGLPPDAACPECGATPGDDTEDAARHSVFNEPGAIFPGGSPAHRAGTIDRSWSCAGCGYDLRGLAVGHPCPECGLVPLDAPPPRGAPGYGTWLARRMTRPRPAWVLPVLALAGGVWSLGTAFVLELMHLGGDLFNLAVLGPTVEEMLKVAALAVVIERRPDLIRSVADVRVAAIGAAAIFATIENLIYLLVYIATPSPAVIAWRVVGCTALHVGCSAVAAGGLVAAWRRTVTEGREPDLAPFVRSATLAIVIHGAYNASVVLLEWSGLAF